MQIVNKNIEELIPYINNPRRNEKAIDKVASSIKNFGFKVPIIIDSKNEIVAGHTRLEASKKLWLKVVPCVVADDLTEAQIKAFRIADNKVSEYAEWDEELLKIELDSIEGLFSGFDIKDIKKIMNNEINILDGEEEFTEVLELENNYIILKFENELDWLQAMTVFNIKPVKCISTRKDGAITEKMKRVGIGRVINGADALNKLVGD